MTEQSQMPLVGPPKRRGWAEIFWFRPLTTSTHATLVVTRRGRLASILPAGGPRVLSDYLAWPYDFREVDTRERLLTLDQRLESFDSSYEFLVSLRLIYQVIRPDRVALELDDVSTELTLAVVQSLRLSGRSFGVEQDKTFEEHLQETLIGSDALGQRAQLLGLVLHRADVIVTLDEPTRAHAEALRFAMRERPLHFQVAVESLEPDRSFDVHVGGVYRLTERRAQDEPGNVIDSAIQTAITRTLRRIGITFEPGDYPNAAKAMAEVLRKDALLQSELAMVHAQLLRPTVQIQPDRSMVHIPRANVLGVSETRSEPIFRRSRQSLPRMGRPPALEDMQERVPQPAPAPPVRRALPPPALLPAESAEHWAAPLSEAPLAEPSASPTIPLGDLPAPGEPIEGAYTLWPSPAAMPIMRALPTPGQPDNESDRRAPWADLIRGNDDRADDAPWLAAPTESLSVPIEPLPWDSLTIEDADQPTPWEHTPAWMADPPASLSAPAELLPWELPATHDSLERNAERPVFGAAFVTEEAESDIHTGFEPEIVPPAPAFVASEQPAFGAAFATEEAESDIHTGSEPEIVSPASAFVASEQPAFGAAFATEELESDIHTGSEPEIVPPAPAFVATEPADDLGFSLDWSEPPSAQVADPAADMSTLLDNPIADDLGFSLDWSETQIDSYAGVPLLNADTIVDNSIIIAPWNEQDLGTPWNEQGGAVSELTPFGDPPLADDAAPAVTEARDHWPAAGLDPEAFDPQQTQLESSPPALEQHAQQDEVLVCAEQEALPWYAPTLHFDAPFESPTDTPTAAPLETFEPAWHDTSAPSEPSLEVAAEPATHAPPEAFEPTWDDTSALSELSPGVAADAGIQPLDEALSAEPVLETPGDQASAQASADSSEQPGAHVEPAIDISSELIARLIGMIQSYGPAWFKMWSLELKERPERLPVVLGEVTADAMLLAQAADSRVQSALLAALAAYTAPPMHPARLSSAALPSPVMASQSNDDQDEVPDWLSLRVKWNGHGGGA